jgi:hypothetical protein
MMPQHFDVLEPAAARFPRPIRMLTLEGRPR